MVTFDGINAYIFIEFKNPSDEMVTLMGDTKKKCKNLTQPGSMNCSVSTFPRLYWTYKSFKDVHQQANDTA